MINMCFFLPYGLFVFMGPQFYVRCIIVLGFIIIKAFYGKAKNIATEKLVALKGHKYVIDTGAVTKS